MTTPSNSPQTTIQEVNAWLLEVTERHADIHIKAANLWNGPHFHEAFVDMAVLFLDTFEEVRVVSEQLREESQATRSQSRTLQARCAQLLEQSTASMKCLAQFMPPPPEEIRQAESEMLDIEDEGQRVGCRTCDVVFRARTRDDLAHVPCPVCGLAGKVIRLPIPATWPTDYAEEETIK
jgi:hypothetical protein